jgi:hypothetical protein
LTTPEGRPKRLKPSTVQTILTWEGSSMSSSTAAPATGRGGHFVFGDLRTWGWITLIIGVLQLLAAGGILTGNQLARWFAVALVGLNAIGQMFFIPAYPFWSLMIIAVDVVALWGLCLYVSRQNLAS